MVAVRRRLSAIQAFLRSQASGGFFLIAASAVALAWANSPLAPAYRDLVQLELGLEIGRGGVVASLHDWVNDGLMALFFLLAGLEIKREILVGELATPRRAALPFIAAAGGMAVPALLYGLVAWHRPDVLHGWAIPAATDIAFALAALALLGRRVPASLRAFLTALAIIDDLGAILIIALFYATDLSAVWLGAATIVCGLLVALNRYLVGRLWPYLAVGLLLWICLARSGIHPTMAGVLLGFAVPLGGGRMTDNGRQSDDLHGRLERRLEPVVAYVVLPAFGLLNAGLSFDGMRWSDLLQPVPLGVALGLFLGKQLGVFGAAWGAIRLRIAALPQGADFVTLYGVALLCGIGFTMSLFIGGLAFKDAALVDEARLGVLTGSSLSALGGLIWLRLATRANGRAPSRPGKPRP